MDAISFVLGLSAKGIRADRLSELVFNASTTFDSVCTFLREFVFLLPSSFDVFSLLHYSVFILNSEKLP